MNIIKEVWNNTILDFCNIIPSKKIENITGIDLNMKLLCDDDIKQKYTQQYNQSIIARAHNEGKIKELQKYVSTLLNSPQFSEKIGIELPQLLVQDSLNNDEPFISLHITKLNSNEIFINNIVLVKNKKFEPIGNGIFEEVITNLTNFAKEQGISVISGYAINYKVLKKFRAKGFKEDKRKDMHNDVLWNMALDNDVQYPFYKIIK